MQSPYHDILKKYWGYDDFRPLQLDIITSIGSGRDTLGLMPTGGGKSITFQVPALTIDGLCLVITPLVALMKDQVEQLHQRGIKAALIYSAMSHQQTLQTLENCEYGAYKFLYISPERLGSELFKNRLPFIHISMIAVDEAHCISQWGYDFRPSYLQIASIRELLPQVPILALTATATPQVVNDIQDKLLFSKHNVFRKSFYRDNIAYVVRQTDNKIGQLLQILNNVPGSSIIYVRNRLKTKEINDQLTQNGISSTYYHAGLPNNVKDERQKAWKEGSCRVIVATNAFGMGIDKPDVRTIVHLDLPDNIEAYFQEAGRAGRDGKKAYAVLLYNNNDTTKLKKRITDNFPEKELIRRIYQSLADYYVIAEGSGQGCVFPFEISKFAVTYHYPILQTFNAIKILELSGWLQLTDEQESPSKLQIIVNKEGLYHLHLNEMNLDNLLELLLRKYTGILNDKVHINEEELAQQLHCSRQDIYLQLQRLDMLRIVNYVPFKKVPLLIYTQQRANAETIYISKEAYEERKERFVHRIESMLDYASDKRICRSKMLLHYFGEKEGKPCEQCDVCLAEKKRNGQSQYNSHLAQTLIQLLQEPHTHQQICDELSITNQELAPTLKLLLADEIVEFDQQNAILKIKKSR